MIYEYTSNKNKESGAPINHEECINIKDINILLVGHIYRWTRTRIYSKGRKVALVFKTVKKTYPFSYLKYTKYAKIVNF